MTSSHSTPPDMLDTDLEIDPDDWKPRDTYFLMTGMVIPRPIGWVSSVSDAGVLNLAPYSYFNAMSNDPPHVVFGSSGRKDSLTNIEQNGEFVCNIVTLDLVERMNFTSTDFPPGEDEFHWAGLEFAPSSRVKPPRVASAKAHLECRCVQIVPAGNGYIVIGKVVHIHVNHKIWKNGRIDPRLMQPVCRLSGNYYAEMGEIFKVERPTWTNIEGTDTIAAMPKRQSR